MKYLSNSEMSDWRQCKRKWWLSSYRGLRRRDYVDFGTAPGIGNRVHECLEHYYRPEGSVNPLVTLNEALARNLAEHPAYENAIQKEFEMCSVMLEGYLEWLAETGADQALRVIASETAMTVPISDEISLISKLDVRIEHEQFGSNLSMDHKTVGNLTQALPMLPLDTQMLTQHVIEYIAQRERGGIERARGVLYNMLLKSKRTARAKGPFYQREPVRHNERQLRTHWQHVLRTAQEIEDTERHLRNGVDHHNIVPPSPSRDCTWKCQFFAVCPMFDDGSDVEAALAAKYVPGDPLERYHGRLPGLAANAENGG